MRTIHLATTSKRKWENLKGHFDRYNNLATTPGERKIDVIWENMEVPEPRSEDPRVIAGGKVKFAHGQIQKDCVAWDSCFYISSLNGFPGPYVHYVTEKIKAEGILRLLGKGMSRECKFQHCLAYLDTEMAGTDGEAEYFTVVSAGSLADSLRGPESEWELHRIFVPTGWNETVAEIIAGGKYQKYRQQRYDGFFKGVADRINERHDWLEH